MSTGIETVSSTYTQTPRKETLKESLLTELLPCKYTRTVPWPVKTPSIISERFSFVINRRERPS